MAFTYEPLGTTTFSSSASSYTFSSIPGTYTDLVLVIYGQVSVLNNSNFIQFNGDTAGNYSITEFTGRSTGTSTTRANTITAIYGEYYGAFPASPDWAVSVHHINNYASTAMYKTTVTHAASPTATDLIIGLWKSTAAITSIKVSQPNYSYNSGTMMTLYGIKAA